jgi:hypothetical protein
MLLHVGPISAKRQPAAPDGRGTSDQFEPPRRQAAKKDPALPALIARGSLGHLASWRFN